MTIRRSPKLLAPELLAIPEPTLCLCGHTAGEHGNRWGGTNCDLEEDECECRVFRDAHEEGRRPDPDPDDPDSCASCEHPLYDHVWNGCERISGDRLVGFVPCGCSGFTTRKRAGQ